MGMNAIKKLLIAGLLLMAILGFFLSHFWSYTVCLLQKAVVVGVVPFLVSSKFLAGMTSMRFLL
jgi:hypothetical protein